MRNRIWVFITFFVLIISSSSVLAGRQWYYQHVVDSMNNPIGGGNTTIGMRSDATWPVVVSNDGTAAMVPGGWAQSSGGISPQGTLDAATSHDGQSIIVAGSLGNVAVFGSSGWSYRYNNVASGGPFYRQSVAFTQNDSPAVLYRSAENMQVTLSTRSGNTWYSNSTGRDADFFALDYDSYNQANVVLHQNSTLVYGTKGVLTGNQWNFSEPIMNLPPINGPVDLQLTANDLPYIAYRANNLLSYTTYDRLQGCWTNGTLDGMSSDNFCMAADFQGGIGVVYLTDGDSGITLGYAYNDGSGTWTTEHLWNNILPLDVSSPLSDKSIGLTFDMENNPVISFNTSNGIWIAYDPFVVPEPATMALLLLGGAFSLRLRKPR
ncbi:MAG: PEP-CTERM sorting domain-containing protein [Planctomycetes bacterium]|nr:PEP-CTERM sorting domain-containing protein [Planctomycetota bacterium]